MELPAQLAASGRIVGWSIADHIRAELVVDALQRAAWRRRPPEGQAIFHSDHGCQSTSWAAAARSPQPPVRRTGEARPPPAGLLNRVAEIDFLDDALDSKPPVGTRRQLQPDQWLI